MGLKVTAVRDIYPEDAFAGMAKNDFVPQGTEGELIKSYLTFAVVFFEDVGDINIPHQFYLINENLERVNRNAKPHI